MANSLLSVRVLLDTRLQNIIKINDFFPSARARMHACMHAHKTLA